MARCSICNEPGHVKTKHDVPCIVCGQTKQFSIEEAVRVRHFYKCGDEKAHEAVRNLWSVPREEAIRVRTYGIHRR